VAGAFIAACVALAGPGVGVAGAASLPSSLVNTIQTWRWSPPSPDPSGLAYDSAANRLIVVDGEVEEMSIYSGANYYEAGLGGGLLRTTNTLHLTKEPVGVAYGSGKIFISDDDADRIHQITLGPDGRFDALDPVASIATTPYGSGDPEGLAYDPSGKRLFIADGAGSEIYQVSAVDGVFGNGDDQVQHFDTLALGVRDPEAVEYRPETGTLYTIGDSGATILELTTAGAVLADIDTSYLPLDRPAGLAWAPRSTDPTQKSLYIADRKVDNDGQPTENDGAIYEIAIGTAPVTPGGDVRVAARADDAEEAASGSVDLSSSDLEFVTDGAFQQTVGIRFAGLDIPPGATITRASIQFVADESQSTATALTLRAQAADTAATFTTTAANVSSRPRTTAAVAWAPVAWTAGAAGEAQRTPDLAPVVQEVVSRPGWASDNALAFLVTGSGHRTAVAYDGSAAKAPLLHVEYSTDGNRPPSVNAGPDQTITLPAGAALDGTVSDDGTPNPTPAVAWSKVSGPGEVTFGDATSVDTSAGFSAAGTYVLRLTADDGALTAGDDVTIVANAPSTGGTLDKRVAARSDDAEEAASGSIDLSSSDLEFVTDKTVQQTVGIRFTGLAIPPGATITSASIQLTADEAQSVSTSLSIRAQASDTAPTFTTATGNLSSRPRTTAAVGWSPAPWTVGAAGADQRTPDLTAVVQEVVSRPGWASGNALAFLVTGTGHRTADAYDGGSAVAPLLHVEYR
jgi:hypothetical protein